MKVNNGAILQEALELLNADWQEAYGNPADNLTRTAALWSAYLRCPVSAKDVALCMALVKLSREAHSHSPDNLVDAAGYIGLAADLATLEAGNDCAV